MDLSDEVMKWLSDEDVPADRADLRSTYSFEHELNKNPWVGVMKPKESLKWRVRFYTSTGNEVLGEVLCRTLYPTAILAGGGRGRVAANTVFNVREEFQRRGLATPVYSSEAQLYKRWGVRQIHMFATGAGRLVWLKPPFSFRPKDLRFLRSVYTQWYKTASGKGQLNLPDPDEDFSKYPEDFLLGLEELELYKELTP